MSQIRYCIVLLAAVTPYALGFVPSLGNLETRFTVRSVTSLAHTTNTLVKQGKLLSDVPTPCLIMELSLAENAARGIDIDEVLSHDDNTDVSFEGCLYVHTKVTDTSERDEITRTKGSGKSVAICNVDVPPEWIPGGAFLGIGLANHHVGGYYWARGMGIGASLPAHGVHFGASEDLGTGKLFWKKRGPGMDAMETTEESSNSNDGKRSEWADFLAVGDTVQLIPYKTNEVLRDSNFNVILGMRRIGRPLGADPIVERIWCRSTDARKVWVRQ